MGCKVLWLNVALLPYLMICEHVRAQCTQPSFESKNAIVTESYLSTQSFPDGSTVTVECETGFKPNPGASKSVTCQGNQWTPLALECTKKSCGSPPDFHNGRYEMEGISFGDKITAVCNTGYMLVTQPKDRWCRDRGWDGRDPLCEVVKCTAPPPIVNGQLEDEPQDSYNYLQAVFYRCNSGFSLIGSSSIHCSENGTFKPDPPICMDGCQKPEVPHAHRIGGRPPPYKLNTFIEYECDTGYTMTGKNSIKCTGNGWNPEPPKCIVVTCKAPPAIVNGQLEEEPQDRYDYLHAVSYRCNSGFSLIGSSSLRCSEDGTFKPDPPKCALISRTTTPTSTIVTSKTRPDNNDRSDTSSGSAKWPYILLGVLAAVLAAVGGACAYKKHRSKHEYSGKVAKNEEGL